MRRMVVLLLLSSAFANVLVSVECPENVYAHEYFSCRVLLYNTADDIELNYRVRSAEGLLESESAGEIGIIKNEFKNIDVNVWAKNVGTDSLIFEYNTKNKKEAHVTDVVVVPSPVRLETPSVTITAGKTGKVPITIKGNASLVSVNVEYPPQVDGDRSVQVGDVKGEKMFSISVTPDPLAMGKVPITVITKFADNTGYHTLKDVFYIELQPSDQMFSIVAVIAVLAALGYFIVRGKKKH